MLGAFGPQSVSARVTHHERRITPTDRKGVGMDYDVGRRLCKMISPALSKPKLFVLLDLLCLALASVPFLAGELGWVEPHLRGLVCGDPSISYPYLHQETVSDARLIAGGVAIAALTIVVGECVRVRVAAPGASRPFVGNAYVASLYKELGGFLFGGLAGQSLTSVAKLTVGRLRPHFLSVCGVTYASLNCTPGAYLETVHCPAPPQDPAHHRVTEARKSFFSGHASFAMYTAVYLSFYLQARWRWSGARLLRPVLQFSLVLLAVYTGLTRVSDHRHHPSDVLTGFLQGGLTACWVVFHVSSMFKRPRRLLPSILPPRPPQVSTC